MSREKQNANLRPPWRKGEKVPGAGRPKGSLGLGARLKKHLKEHPEEMEAHICELVTLANDGNAAALKILWDRHDGPLTQRIEQVQTDVVARVMAACEAVLSEDDMAKVCDEIERISFEDGS